MSIDELRQFITTDKTDLVLDAQLQALELLIREIQQITIFRIETDGLSVMYHP